DKVSEGHEVFLVCETDAEAERLQELFKSSKLMGEGQVARIEEREEALAEPVAPENGNALLDKPAVAPEESKLAHGRPRLHFVVGHLEAGFRIVPQRVVLVSAAELFQRQDLARTTRRRQARAIDSFLELREGD